MRRRQPLLQSLLSRTRGHDYSSCSDEELRAAIRCLRSRAGEASPGELLPDCFAIMAEAIDRRLGVWKLFEDTASYGTAAGDASVVATAVAEVSRQRRHRRAGYIMLPTGFYQAARAGDGEGRLIFRATDEQLMAGIHLFHGRAVQMDAGEGKTVAIAFAAALHAVAGRRVHVVTANDYLADRDSALLEPVFRCLGLSSGAVLGHMEDGERRHLYRRSIVYGSMREFGFDYLRDGLKSSASDVVQQPLDVAIVDEADHALIDEAFTPLIISGNPMGGTRMAVRVDRAVGEMIGLQRELAGGLAADAGTADVGPIPASELLATLLLAEPDNPILQGWSVARPRLRRQATVLAEDEAAALSSGLYYAVHPGGRFVTLTEKGRVYLERRLGSFRGDAGVGLAVPKGRGRYIRDGALSRRAARRYALENQVSQALTAHLLLKRDVDYLVDLDGVGDDGVVLIDPHTGRPKPDSIYQHGLQSAVEAREGVTVRPNAETLAQTSVAGFAGRYRSLAGITGTAVPATDEFRRKYGLEVAVVPPAKASGRSSVPPRVHLTREDKLSALVDEVAWRHRTGQPVLVSTRTVEQSGELALLLENRGVPHRVLNAVTTHAEAAIVRDAGSFGAVTVATHMAGRGTDILLEPGLDDLIAERCVAEIGRVLDDESDSAGAVKVSCPSREQAEILLGRLRQSGRFHAEEADNGCGISVTLSGREAEGKHISTLGFALGLCVIGTEVHDSSRITLQLNGRSGRQGQFGLAQTFLSLEDRLVSLEAEAILKLSGCRQADAAGRVYYSGADVTRRIERLQADADHESEAQRAFTQDYAAELDRQTDLYHQRRRQVIDAAGESTAIEGLWTGAAARLAARLAAAYLGPETDDDYMTRFEALSGELLQEYGVECPSLYGLDLSLVPGELEKLLIARTATRASEARNGSFPELARLLYLRVCGEFWPAHLSLLRDTISSQLLSGRYHKSAVAMYIGRCSEHWHGFWDHVDAEFLSRLATMPLTAAKEPASRTLSVSSETERLLLLQGLPRGKHQEMTAAPDGG